MEEVQALAPQLLIMGRHGYTGLTRLLMGSVTARVIGHSPVNVLVAPKGAELSFKRLLVANDGSPYSAAAWEAALSLTLRLGSRLLGAAVARDEGAIPRVRQVVQDMEAEAKRRGAPLEPFLLEGQPFDAILNLARQKQATLIILGSHGRTGLKRLLMGSTAERVIGLADCPVLVVKRPAE
jgi:nucleotide-binding universal stress UspA family protein